MGIAEENLTKKRKPNHCQFEGKKFVLVTNQPKLERCPICRQYITEALLYNGHPNNSLDEYVALTDKKLMLFTGDESTVNDLDFRPTHKVTNF